MPTHRTSHAGGDGLERVSHRLTLYVTLPASLAIAMRAPCDDRFFEIALTDAALVVLGGFLDGTVDHSPALL